MPPIHRWPPGDGRRVVSAQYGRRQVVELPAALARFQQPIEAELRSLIADRQEPLYGMMQYALGWMEQDGTPRPGHEPLRLHASLCLLACRALGADIQQALPAAAAVELVHHYSLVHDDIRDGNSDRDQRPAVWWVWGPAQAINAGDGLDALARLSLLGLAGRGVSTDVVLKAAWRLDQACLELCEGQYQEIRFQEQLQVSQATYLKMVEKRAGALLGCAAALGALCAAADEDVCQKFQRTGQKLGVARQIRDDLLHLWGSLGDTASTGDILNKKKSLPVVHAMEAGEPQARRELGTLYLQRVLDPKNLPRIIEILDAAGSRQHCQSVARDAKEEALAALAEAGLGDEALDEFGQVGMFLLQEEA